MLPKDSSYTMIIIAPRNSGKSTLIKQLLDSEKNRFYNGLIISGSEKNSPFFSNFIPKKLIKYEFKDKYVDKVEKVYQLSTKIGEKKYRKESVVVLDDVSNHLKKKDNKSATDLFTNGRHYQASVIVTTQYATSIPPCWRENTDIILIGKLRGEKSMKCTHEMVSSVFPDYKQFKSILKKYTRNYKFLLVTLNVKQDEDSSSDISDLDDNDYIKMNCFYVKCDPTLKTKLLPDEFRTKEEIFKHYSNIGKEIVKDRQNNLYIRRNDNSLKLVHKNRIK